MSNENLPPLIALESDGSKWVQLEGYRKLQAENEELKQRLESKRKSANLTPPPTSDTVRGGGWSR